VTMAKPVRISYTKRDTIKIGDFETVSPSWSEEWELAADDDPAAMRQALVERVESMFRTIVRRSLRQTIERRVNMRDEETEEYMDEACDYFKVSQGRKGGRAK
jgi:hypothetical protein